MQKFSALQATSEAFRTRSLWLEDLVLPSDFADLTSATELLMSSVPKQLALDRVVS